MKAMRVTTTACRLAVLASVVMATPMIATGQGRGTQWVQEATLTAPSGPIGDFGADVAIDGDTVVVGASQAAVGGNTSQGAAYVHTRVFGTWIPTAQLTASGGAAGDWFGYSVAIVNDTIVVGARYADVNGKSDQGAAYVFTQASGTWTQTAVLTAQNGAARDYFGSAVAIDGTTIVVGAEWSAGCVGEPPCGRFRATGTAHVFTEGDGVWTEAATLTAPNGLSGDFFGTSVAIHGDTVVVGEHQESTGQGAAYVFTRTDGAWTQTAELSVEGPTNPGRFGWSVAIHGDTVVVGASGKFGEVGKAYVFTQTGCGCAWTETATLVAPSNWFAQGFGDSVAVSGDRVVVGAPSAAEVDGNSEPGAAFLYSREGNAWTETATLFPANRVGGSIGASVAIAGSTAVVRGTNAVYVFVRKLPSS